MPNQPFRILGLQQIAIGAPEKSALSALWCETLGVKKTGDFRSERENVDEDILTLGKGPHAVEVDLMAPIDIEARPKVHQPALNHIGLWVDDLDAAVEWLAQQGVRFAPGGIRRGASGHRICFVHPKGDAAHPIGAGGVRLELVEAPPEVREALGG